MVEAPEQSGCGVWEFNARLGASAIWLFAGIATFAVSTLILYATLDRWPDPYDVRGGASMVLDPIGPGPGAMPAINADLYAVYATDARHVWVAGKNALIAYSAD